MKIFYNQNKDLNQNKKMIKLHKNNLYRFQNKALKTYLKINICYIAKKLKFYNKLKI